MKALRFRLVASLASLCICLLIVGVSVFAATTQVTTVTDSVTITSEIAVAVTVEQKLGADDGVLLTGTGADFATISGGAFTERVSKSANEQQKTGSGLNPVFSYTNGYTYTAYKITMTNAHTSIDATYTIALTGYTGDSQLTVYYADEAAMGTGSLLSGDLVVAAGPTVVYVVIAVNTELDEIEPLTTNNFTLTITCLADLT